MQQSSRKRLQAATQAAAAPAAAMSDTPPAAAKAGSKSKKAGKKPVAAAEPEGPRPPFKPAKMTHYDRQVGAARDALRCCRRPSVALPRRSNLLRAASRCALHCCMPRAWYRCPWLLSQHAAAPCVLCKAAFANWRGRCTAGLLPARCSTACEWWPALQAMDSPPCCGQKIRPQAARCLTYPTFPTPAWPASGGGLCA